MSRSNGCAADAPAREAAISDTTAADPVDVVRGRLLILRADLIRQLAEAEALDAGFLRLLGDVGGALAALEGVADLQ